MTKLSELDLDALRRAIAWGHGFQQRNPQIVVFPATMPTEGTPEWLELAQHLASNAQSHHLGLRPWQTPPIHADNHCKPEEIALLETMISLNISRYEPDPPAAIDAATLRPGATRGRRQR
jgi:hypothetical protein